MLDINNRYMQHLSQSEGCQGKQFVCGDGKMTRPVLMLIGEAPGKDEVRNGRPFVGKAGQNLSRFLEILELERNSIYITNVVKIRPTQPGKNNGERNRAPSSREVELFKPWLLDEIQYVQPQALVTLGNTPLKALIGKDSNIGDMHGVPVDTPCGHKLFPLYHPAAIIYNRSLVPVYDEDLVKLRHWIHQFSQ